MFKSSTDKEHGSEGEEEEEDLRSRIMSNVAKEGLEKLWERKS